MNKQKLLEKRYIVRLLALILGKGRKGGESNIGIARELGKPASSIHKQLSYLEKQGLIYKERDKKSKQNRKVYFVEGDKLTELFLKYIEQEKDIKNLMKFKNKAWIGGTVCLFIWHTLNPLNREESKDRTLKYIFECVFGHFLSFRDSLLNKDEKLLKRYTNNSKTDENQMKKEIKLFTSILKSHYEIIKSTR